MIFLLSCFVHSRSLNFFLLKFLFSQFHCIRLYFQEFSETFFKMIQRPRKVFFLVWEHICSTNFKEIALCGGGGGAHWSVLPQKNKQCHFFLFFLTFMQLTVLIKQVAHNCKYPRISCQEKVISIKQLYFQSKLLLTNSGSVTTVLYDFM